MSRISSPSAPLEGSHATWADSDTAHALFAVEGMRCTNCSRAVERAVAAVQGVLDVRVNLATARASVSWDPALTTLRQVLASVDQAGFKSVPLAGSATAEARRAERRLALKRIGLAGLGMMQTMMLVYGLYVGNARGMDPSIASYLKLAGMLFATPVLLYSGKPFFEGALRSLRQRALSMDVPVALALALAYGASVINTLRGSAETYFDSVTMFVFFLLTGRFLELTIRQGSLTATEALTRSLPSEVTRVYEDGKRERIPVTSIGIGDRLSVPRGTVIPVDAMLRSSSALIDEALVTGESVPIQKSQSDKLLGGSINAGDAIEIVARSQTKDSTLAHIVGLLERAPSQRPRVLRAADRIAARFVLATLLLSCAVAVMWYFIEPARAFSAALAILVVTCPCALSLATPTAMAAATARLAGRGLMVTRADALERLAEVNVAVLEDRDADARHARGRSIGTSGDMSPRRALAISAALESSSSHPLAAAFSAYVDPLMQAADVKEYAGCGMEGTVEAIRWRLGRLEFVTDAPSTRAVEAESSVVLGHSGTVLAEFSVHDTVRADAQSAVQALKRLDVDVVLASGDQQAEVTRVGEVLGVVGAFGALTPQLKLEVLAHLHQKGLKSLVLGDGINDGPVLAGGYVSCAMGQGSAVALAAADMLLLNEHLMTLPQSIQTARRMLAVVRQNLLWAFIYNMAAIPAAALGWIAPWAAALGMSLSSLAVVLNSARVARVKAGSGDTIAPGEPPHTAPRLAA